MSGSSTSGLSSASTTATSSNFSSSITSAASSATSNLVSQTFSNPFPTSGNGPSTGNNGGNGNGNGGGGGNNPNGPSLASSASLYLYTFLATLVLLLSVSAAIVIRSLLLRRRHRRMVEEAIRNGTYVPPSAFPGGRGKVDLGAKPKLYEVYLGLGALPTSNEKGEHPLAGPGGGSGSGGGGYVGGLRGTYAHQPYEHDGVEWEGIVPFSASLTTPLPTSFPSSSISSNTTNNASSSTTNITQSRPTFSQRVGASFRTGLRGAGVAQRGLWGMISSNSRVYQTQGTGDAGNANSSSTSPNTNRNIGVAGTSTSNAQGKSPQMQQLPSHPTTTPAHLSVSVLIAMPSQIPISQRLHKPPSNSQYEDEEDLPHLEMGVAEVEVPPEVKEEDRVAEVGGKEGKGKESVEV